MGVTTPIFFVSCFWATSHVLYRYLTSSQSLLPTTVASARTRRTCFCNRSSMKVTLNHAHLRVSTTSWNYPHDRLASRLEGKLSTLKVCLSAFYDLGCFVGAVGMLVATWVLVWITWSLGKRLLFFSGHNALDIRLYPKRDLADEPLASYSTNTGSILKPIIPGITVPLAHLPPILLAVFVGQVIHEFGHGIAAAVEKIPLLSSGVSLILVVPSAFVSLSSASLSQLQPRARMRIITAGPYHNFVFWLLILGFGWTGVGKWVTELCYLDVAQLGKVVVELDKDSPLRDHLPHGAIITKLDDRVLSSLDGKNTWMEYLTQPKPPGEMMGWCIEKSSSPDTSRLCCPPLGSTIHTELSCFTSLDELGSQQCLDPVAILTRSGSRCSSYSECTDRYICMHPHESEQLLRITMRRPEVDTEEVVLWSGPKREVLEQVQVGSYLPRHAWLPLWFPRAADTFIEYMKMAMLSLWLANLLPVSILDGGQLLDVILDVLFVVQSEDFDLTQLEGGRQGSTYSMARSAHWRGRIRMVAEVGNLVCVGLSFVLGLLNALR